MIKVTTNFDSRKFAKGLERQASSVAKKHVRQKLQDLVSRGLRISDSSANASGMNLLLEGPEELIKEARRRFS
jgi:hypothetical protein